MANSNPVTAKIDQKSLATQTIREALRANGFCDKTPSITHWDGTTRSNAPHMNLAETSLVGIRPGQLKEGQIFGYGSESGVVVLGNLNVPALSRRTEEHLRHHGPAFPSTWDNIVDYVERMRAAIEVRVFGRTKPHISSIRVCLTDPTAVGEVVEAIKHLKGENGMRLLEAVRSRELPHRVAEPLSKISFN